MPISTHQTTETFHTRKSVLSHIISSSKPNITIKLYRQGLPRTLQSCSTANVGPEKEEDLLDLECYLEEPTQTLKKGKTMKLINQHHSQKLSALKITWLLRKRRRNHSSPFSYQPRRNNQHVKKGPEVPIYHYFRAEVLDVIKKRSNLKIASPNLKVCKSIPQGQKITVQSL